MSAAPGLFRLQQVDTRIGQTESRLRAIQETLENDAELQAAQQKLQAAEQEEFHHEHDRRSAEEGARDQQIKIQQAESNLYGGKVHNPKELQDLQADVLSLKKHLSAIEELELEAMVKLEASQTALRAAQEDLGRVQARVADANRHLLIEQEKLLRELADLQSERQAAISAVDSGILSGYEALRQRHRGLAVAVVVDNACGACGTTVTAALQQSARHAVDLVFCPSCGRILFAP
jgi:uncharacterized protein